jgi:hypothetical protein
MLPRFLFPFAALQKVVAMSRRRLPFVVGLILLIASINSIGQSNSLVAPATTPSPESQLTRLPPEVRLRKLHLVRPDLIQYPISFEVYC